jgi:putative hydrolase of the HAD superfamily
MLRDTRAVIFDLDDTIYPLERFVLSGFDAVATHLQRLFNVPQEPARTALRQAFYSGHRGKELQVCLRQFGLPEALAPSLVQVIRAHQPALDLPASAAHALSAMATTWRIGIVTNGPIDIQSRKVAALGLSDFVDEIVFADGERAKPAAAPFLEVTRRLRVPLRRSIFVGNDPVCDVYGAWRLGMKTIHVAGQPAAPALMADAEVHSLVEVPDIAERLVA